METASKTKPSSGGKSKGGAPPAAPPTEETPAPAPADAPQPAPALAELAAAASAKKEDEETLAFFHSAYQILGLTFLVVAVFLLLDTVRANAWLLAQGPLHHLAPSLLNLLEGALPNFKKFSTQGWVVNLAGFGVLLNHQASVKGGRLAVGALCALASCTGLYYYLSQRAGTATPAGEGLFIQAFINLPLACFALIGYAYSRGSQGPARYAPTSYTALLHAAAMFALGALALFGEKGAASKFTLVVGSSPLESGCYLASLLALASLTLHSGMNDRKAAASQLCACATMALGFGFIGYKSDKVLQQCWRLVGFYGVLAILAALESSLKGGKRQEKEKTP
jgi:hypothetical protein